jgi:hypothetical protein
MTWKYDLTGKVFGHWTVLEKMPTVNKKYSIWKCRCSCGKEAERSGYNLRNGRATHCGCRWAIDLVGMVFHRWTVISKYGKDKKGIMCWWCRCECGTERKIRGVALRHGSSKSCGCFSSDLQKSRVGVSGANWQGGRQKRKTGYVLLYKKGHPNSDKTHHIAEHIYIMSEHIGRPLIKGETVHHKNGIRDDNRIENLELWCKNHPIGTRTEDLVIFAKEILLKYEPSCLLITSNEDKK